MQGRKRKIFGKSLIQRIDALKLFARFLKRRTLPENPRDQLKGRDIVFAGNIGAPLGVFGEIQSRHAKPHLVGGIVIKRIVVRDIGNADHRKMLRHRGKAMEMKRKMPRRYRNALTIGIFQIQIASEIMIFGFEGNSSTHSNEEASPCPVLL